MKLLLLEVIENNLHRVRDVSFSEDKSTIRKGHAPEVMSGLRNLVISIFQRGNVKSYPQAFRGYVSFGGHGAADNLPRIDEIKLHLTELYQPGARNIYFEEAASRKFGVLQRAQQIYAAQPADNRSVFIATQQALGHNEQSIQRSRDILTKYRSVLARIGPHQLKTLMYRTDPQLEQARIFTLAEYEMLDSLPTNFNLEFTSEAFTPKELNKLKALVERSEQFSALLVNSLMRGDTNSKYLE